MRCEKINTKLKLSFKACQIKETNNYLFLYLNVVDQSTVVYLFEVLFPQQSRCTLPGRGRCLVACRTKFIDGPVPKSSKKFPKDTEVIMEERKNIVSFYWKQNDIFYQFDYAIRKGLECVYGGKNKCAKNKRVVELRYIKKIEDRKIF